MSKKFWIIGGSIVAVLAVVIAAIAFFTTSRAIEEVEDQFFKRCCSVFATMIVEKTAEMRTVVSVRFSFC